MKLFFGGGSSKAKKSPTPSRKELTDAKPRLSQALWTAEHSPAKTADFSHCALAALTPEIVAAVRFGKDALLLHNNFLPELPAAIGQLSKIQVLDLHNNYLTGLPAEFSRLALLTSLDLESNRFTVFPSAILALTSLLRLNIKDNEISEIPAEIGGLVNLTYLNLANNPIVRLPVEIHKLKGLEALVLDGLQATLQYPPASAAASTDDVMAFLCKEAGVEFVPPGDVALAAVVTPAASAATAPHVLARESAFLALRQSEQERIDQLMKLRDQEHQEALAKQEMLRKSRLEQQEQRTALLTQRQQDRQDMATVVNLAISTAQENALKLQEGHRQLRARILDIIRKEQEEETEKAKQLVDSYEAAHNDPRLRQALLQQQSAAEQQQLAVALAKTASQEAAVEALRKQEAEASQLAKHVVLKMSDAQAMALEQLRECQERLNTTLDAYVTEVERARQERGQCLAETEKQAMMLSAGAELETAKRTQKRNEEMKAIEAELARMVEAGVSESQHRRATQAAVLQETRAELEKRLAALKLEAANKERRQRELLLAIDEDDRRNYRSYWQARLAYTADHAASADNAKAAPSPSPVVDPVVNTVLDQAGVPQYGALFAQHRVDAVVLRILTADDLQNMGITVVGDQKRILAAVAQLFDVKQ